jgi:hypothetical protein
MLSDFTQGSIFVDHFLLLVQMPCGFNRSQRALPHGGNKKTNALYLGVVDVPHILETTYNGITALETVPVHDGVRP